jgi:hypothetical protein
MEKSTQKGSYKIYIFHLLLLGWLEQEDSDVARTENIRNAYKMAVEKDHSEKLHDDDDDDDMLILKWIYSNPGRGRNCVFTISSRLALARTHPPISHPMGTGGSFPGGKAAGAWSWPLNCIQCGGYEDVEL